MEIKVIEGVIEPDYENIPTLRIEVNGKRRVHVSHPEPEDATLIRDLNFAYDIVPLMREAYEAGKVGEEFTVTEEKDEDE